MHLFSLLKGVSRRLVFVTLIANTAAAGFAQTAPLQLDTLIVQGRQTSLVGTASSPSQGIVGSEELAARPFLRRGELLEVIPGVVITQHSGDGKANQYFLRGFNLDHGTDFSIGVDGMPVNLRSHAHGQGYADLNFIIPELVRQVDYSKGPFFADVGDFSSAGAAEFRLVDRIAHPFVTLTFGANNYARFVLAGTMSSGTSETTAAIEATHDDGPWLLPEHSTRSNVLVRHHWTSHGDSFRLTLLGYSGRWRSSDQIPLRATQNGTLDRYGNLDPTDGGDSSRASLSFDASLSGPSGATRINLHAITYQLNLFSNFTYFLDDPFNGDQFNQRDGRTVFGGSILNNRPFTTASVTTEVATGAQFRADRIGDLGIRRTVARRTLSTVRDDDVQELSAGLFARAETRWNDWLRTNAGVRYDGYSFKVTSDTPANSGSRLADIVSPKAGLSLRPRQGTEIYGNAGFGFHSNDARGATIRVEPVDRMTPADRVNPLVRSRGAEIGIRTALVKGLVSTLSLWTLDLDSELVFVGDAGGTEPSGRTRRTGIELANFYRATPWLAFDADLALTRARYRDEPGAPYVANSISKVVTAGVTAGLKRGTFGSMRVRYFGAHPLVEDNSARAPSSFTLNLRSGWRADTWEVAVDILNALNRADYDIAYSYVSRLRNEPSSGVEDIHFHPAEPRTIRLSFSRNL
jgi:hypothetical protein